MFNPVKKKLLLQLICMNVCIPCNVNMFWITQVSTVSQFLMCLGWCDITWSVNTSVAKLRLYCVYRLAPVVPDYVLFLQLPHWTRRQMGGGPQPELPLWVLQLLCKSPPWNSFQIKVTKGCFNTISYVHWFNKHTGKEVTPYLIG